MKNLAITSSVTPLSIDQLNKIIGGDGGPVDVNDLLGLDCVIVEDTTEL